jgi:hypothetical protein
MPTVLLLRGIESGDQDRRALDERENEALAIAARELVSFATPADQGAVVHERDGEVVAAWTSEGALRLADLLPPAHDGLASEIRSRHQA